MRIAYDISLMRPGCVLVQAAMGADVAAANAFGTEHWLLAPTDNMRVYPITPSQLEILVRKTEAHHRANPPPTASDAV